MLHQHSSSSATLALIALIACNSAYAGESYDWSGFYLGGNFGYGSGDSDVINPALDAGSELDGSLGGVQLGYNWQIQHFVVGIETDFTHSGMKYENATSSSPFDDRFSEEETLNNFVTLRLRLGIVPKDNLLLYVTTGAVSANMDYNAYFSSSTGNSSYPVSYNTNKFGWTVGAGAELGLTENITVRAEYLHLMLENDLDPWDLDSNGDLIETSWDTRVDIFRVGLNYLF